MNEDEGVGGALDRAIAPDGASRSAPSADVDEPYAQLNFFGPIVVFAFVCILRLILKPFWIGQLGAAVALAIVFLSFTLVIGEGGMLWLCEITFAGVGAIATACSPTIWGARSCSRSSWAGSWPPSSASSSASPRSAWVTSTSRW